MFKKFWFDRERFDVEMARKQLSLAKLSRKLDVQRPLLSYVRGGYLPNSELQVKIAAELGVEVNNLWQEVLDQ